MVEIYRKAGIRRDTSRRMTHSGISCALALVLVPANAPGRISLL